MFGRTYYRLCSVGTPTTGANLHCAIYSAGNLLSVFFNYKRTTPNTGKGKLPGLRGLT
jgi:hypothetical protein